MCWIIASASPPRTARGLSSIEIPDDVFTAVAPAGRRVLLRKQGFRAFAALPTRAGIDDAAEALTRPLQ